MFRWISKEIEIFRLGEAIVLDCADMSVVRGQAELRMGTVGSTVLHLVFSVRPSGALIEIDAAHRLTLATSMMHTTAITCTGYASVGLKVATASGGTADIAILTLGVFSDHDHANKDGRMLTASELGDDNQEGGFGFDVPGPG